MQEIHDKPLFQKSYDLYKNLHEQVKRYAKGDRYSLGEETKKKTLELMS